MIGFLAEWTLRSSILIAAGAVLLRAFRVKDPAVRLAVWTAALCGSLAIPMLTTMAPRVPLMVMRAPAPAAPIAPLSTLPDIAATVPAAASAPFDWARAAAYAYGAVAVTLLLRLAVGLLLGGRLIRTSRQAGVRNGISFRESDAVGTPVTLGIARPVIVLPGDWREWSEAKLDAVLAHERSHIRRNDPALQVVSALHRALLWHSPLSWYLHRRVVRLAEEASDDAAVAATQNRASYAEVLLEFMQRGGRRASWQGVAMASYGRPDERIHRILDGTAVSRGVSRRGVAAILALGAPLAYLAAAAQPQKGEMAPAAVETAVATAAAAPVEPQAPTASPAPQSGRSIRRYMIFDSDSTSGSWDSRDPVDEDALRQKFGRHFAWFRQDGKEYVIVDAEVLAELRQANEPQREVNREQERVNALQSVVNGMQSQVNEQQNEVNQLQGEVNRRQDLVNKIQSAASQGDKDALIQKLEEAARQLRAARSDATQEEANRRQSKVNEAQGRVNAEQAKVNAEQAKVNEQQHRVSAEYSRKIQEIFQSAVERRLVQQLM